MTKFAIKRNADSDFGFFFRRRRMNVVSGILFIDL